MIYTITVTGVMYEEVKDYLDTINCEVVNFGGFKRVKYAGAEEGMGELCDTLESSGLKIESVKY